MPRFSRWTWIIWTLTVLACLWIYGSSPDSAQAGELIGKLLAGGAFLGFAVRRPKSTTTKE